MDTLRADVEKRLREAFAGVVLGSGTSLRQGEVANNYGRGYTSAQIDAMPLSEVTDDWTKVPQAELERDGAIPHLDGEGFRYYLPALLLSLLDQYDQGWSMTMIFTMQLVTPDKRDLETAIWLRYSHLSDAQKSAVAYYLRALPQLVHLDADNSVRVERRMRDYWRQYLPPGPDVAP